MLTYSSNKNLIEKEKKYKEDLVKLQELCSEFFSSKYRKKSNIARYLLFITVLPALMVGDLGCLLYIGLNTIAENIKRNNIVKLSTSRKIAVNLLNAMKYILATIFGVIFGGYVILVIPLILIECYFSFDKDWYIYGKLFEMKGQKYCDLYGDEKVINDIGKVVKDIKFLCWPITNWLVPFLFRSHTASEQDADKRTKVCVNVLLSNYQEGKKALDITNKNTITETFEDIKKFINSLSANDLEELKALLLKNIPLEQKGVKDFLLKILHSIESDDYKRNDFTGNTTLSLAQALCLVWHAYNDDEKIVKRSLYELMLHRILYTNELDDDVYYSLNKCLEQGKYEELEDKMQSYLDDEFKKKCIKELVFNRKYSLLKIFIEIYTQYAYGLTEDQIFNGEAQSCSMGKFNRLFESCYRDYPGIEIGYSQVEYKDFAQKLLLRAIKENMSQKDKEQQNNIKVCLDNMDDETKNSIVNYIKNSCLDETFTIQGISSDMMLFIKDIVAHLKQNIHFLYLDIKHREEFIADFFTNICYINCLQLDDSIEDKPSSTDISNIKVNQHSLLVDR